MTPNKSPHFELKSGSVDTLLFVVKTTDLDAMRVELARRFRATPDFFANDVVAIDVRGLADHERVAPSEIARLLENMRVRPLGVVARLPQQNWALDETIGLPPLDAHDWRAPGGGLRGGALLPLAAATKSANGLTAGSARNKGGRGGKKGVVGRKAASYPFSMDIDAASGEAAANERGDAGDVVDARADGLDETRAVIADAVSDAAAIHAPADAVASAGTDAVMDAIVSAVTNATGATAHASQPNSAGEGDDGDGAQASNASHVGGSADSADGVTSVTSAGDAATSAAIDEAVVADHAASAISTATAMSAAPAAPATPAASTTPAAPATTPTVLTVPADPAAAPAPAAVATVVATPATAAVASAGASASASSPTTLVIDRPLRSGQRVYARGDVVVLDLVSNGAEVIAEGNIHIYAPLRGRALAGVQGNHDARIFCTCLEAELISVAGIYRTIETPLPPDMQGKPVQIRLDGERLLIEPMKLT